MLVENTQYFGFVVIKIRFSGLNGCFNLANWKLSFSKLSYLSLQNIVVKTFWLAQF